MAEKQYYWLKLQNDFFKQKEIKKLRRIAGGDTLTIIYLKIALLSLENDGILIFEGIEDTFSSELSLELDEPDEDIQMLLSFLQRNKMIEQKGEDFYLNRIPEMTGKETGAAKRMRLSRQRNNGIICNNVTPVLQSVTQSKSKSKSKSKSIEKDTEKDTEKEKEKEKDNKYNVLFVFYIEADLIHHKTLTPAIKKAIDIAEKELMLDVEQMKRIIDRHKKKTEETKNTDFKTKVRTLAELFGQKKYMSSSLICSDYIDEVWEDTKKKNVNNGVIINPDHL